MAFERRRISSLRPNKRRFFSPILLIILGMILVATYFSIKSVGDIAILSGNYTLDKGSTLSSLPLSFDIDVSTWRYKVWLKFFAPSIKSLQAGSYTLTEATSLTSLIGETLSKPVHTDLTITILPGWNMYDIDSYLSDKNIVPAGGFLLAARDHFLTFQEKYRFLEGRLSMEGYLYPDTYRILPTSDAYMVIDKLLGEWEKKIGDTYSRLGEDAYESVILASIVEREEKVSAQKAIVAGILAKRVEEGIAMGADATVCYGYAKTQKQCTPLFIGSVIGQKHPYNTRNKQGYPPTPIANFSLDTWKAVLDKESSPYYYYLHDSTGEIHYARTNAEHVVNKQKYLQ